MFIHDEIVAGSVYQIDPESSMRPVEQGALSRLHLGHYRGLYPGRDLSALCSADNDQLLSMVV